MKIQLSKEKINEICGRGRYWEEVAGRDGDHFSLLIRELTEVVDSVGIHNVLAMIKIWADDERERLLKTNQPTGGY